MNRRRFLRAASAGVGTRVPVKARYDYPFEAGDSLDEFINDFPSVTRAQAVAVLELARARWNWPADYVLWGIPAGQDSPAVVIAAYGPDPAKWGETWRRRRT